MIRLIDKSRVQRINRKEFFTKRFFEDEKMVLFWLLLVLGS